MIEPLTPTKSFGLSLVELMVALLLGSILTLGVITFFSTNKSTFHVQDGLGRLQENARLAKILLTKELRMVGYQGCPSANSIVPVNVVSTPEANQTFSENNLINGFNGEPSGWSPTLPTWLTDNLETGTAIVPNTDILIVRHTGPEMTFLSADMSTDSSSLSTFNEFPIQAGNILMITDCEDANIFMATTGTTSTSIQHTTPENTTNALSKPFLNDAQVGLLHTNAFYLKDTGRTNREGNAIIALYRQDISGTETELVDGVEDMQITYGIDTDFDGSANQYQTAEAVNSGNNWTNVVSINVALLLNSIEPASPEPQPYTFVGSSTTPTDRMLRRQWDTFITLRNRNV